MTGTSRNASQSDEAARVRLGAGAATGPDVLADLVDDPSVTVRAALALNTAMPAHLNDALTRDRDERVRVLLARKLAALVPGLHRWIRRGSTTRRGTH